MTSPVAILRRRRQRATSPRVVLPPDPRLVLGDPLDPALLEIRAALQPHRRRLWLRRLVRRA
jgi:hypothetical protein